MVLCFVKVGVDNFCITAQKTIRRDGGLGIGITYQTLKPIYLYWCYLEAPRLIAAVHEDCRRVATRPQRIYGLLIPATQRPWERAKLYIQSAHNIDWVAMKKTPVRRDRAVISKVME